MADFLDLDLGDQKEIIQSCSIRAGRREQVLEKDIWVCWVLKTLFEMPDRPDMAFKGGTSLSKVFKAINRFSEDIDISFDYRQFDNSFDPKDISKKKIKKVSTDIKNIVYELARDKIVPYLKERLPALEKHPGIDIELLEDGETIQVNYPSLFDVDGYISSRVLVELGGRNTIEPNSEYMVTADIAESVNKSAPDLSFPSGRIVVLSPQRTFWEKVTLIHVYCNHPAPDLTRRSRHWYDLVMLAKSEIGKTAIENRVLLSDVIGLKKLFYNSAYAKYDHCLCGKLHLIPERDEVLALLRNDYKRMMESGMFYDDIPSFEEICEILQKVQCYINDLMS